MSIELRWFTRGRCECGSVVVGNYTPECEHWTECDLGKLGPNAAGDPRKPLEDLLLAPADYVNQLLAQGVGELSYTGGMNTVTRSLDGKLFAHIEYKGHKTSYELFPAHYKDEPDIFMIGKRVAE